jgi:hypothetical protein
MLATTLESVADMEEVIATAEVKKKLQAGGFSSGHLDEFCRVLSLRLNDEITPLGFLMAFELLIMDMEKAPGREIRGVGEPIPSYIAGLPIGGVCRLVMRTIVKKVFPEDFAKQIIEEWQGVLQDAGKAT